MLALIVAVLAGASSTCEPGWWGQEALADPCDVLSGVTARDEIVAAAQ